MSADAAVKATTPDEAPQLSEKHQKLLIAGVLSSKGGLPDVDYDRLTKLGGFNTKKTAQNQWGELKKVLKSINPEAYEAAAATKPAPAKPTATPKKRGKKESDGEEATEVQAGEEAPPSAKKVKSTPRKNQADVDAADGGDSPTKKPKAAPRKKATPKKAKAAEEAPEEAAATKSNDEGEKVAEESKDETEKAAKTQSEDEKTKDIEKTPIAVTESDADTEMEGASDE